MFIYPLAQKSGKSRARLFAATLLLLSIHLSAWASWEKQTHLPTAETPVDLAACKKENCFYAATPHQVFQNMDNNWRSVFSIHSGTDLIQRIYVSPFNSFLWIQTWQKIYRVDPTNGITLLIYETNNPEKFPLIFSAGPENLWIGTSAGLWLSQDSGKTWAKRSDLADHQIVSLVFESSMGLFFAENGSWRVTEDAYPQTVLKLFEAQNLEEDPLSSEQEDSQTFSDRENLLFHDFIETEEKFYLATAKGVFESQNGFDWQMLSGSGLRNYPLYRLSWDQKNKHLVGISQEGFFVFDATKRMWQSQNEGLAKTDMRSLLTTSPVAQLLAVNSEGLWSWQETLPSKSMNAEKAQAFNRLLRLEPSARDIHKHVIQYSDTGNGKIKSWHLASRLAALAPNFSLGKDYSNANNIDIDRGGTSDPDRFIEGPHDKDRGVDLDLSWDLGDFIFGSSQTSIDSREKLMVDLRNDLLSEATRLFYERRRLQAEILYAPAPDEKTHFERLLRLEELTALIDALTDGYLSKKLASLYKNNSAFEALWCFENHEPRTRNQEEKQ